MRDLIAMLDGLGDWNVSPSAGGNYGGGSSYPGDGFPTYPQTQGLAGPNARYRPGGYLVDTVHNVSPSAGGNYGGGSSWAPEFPTMPSSSGLAGGYIVQRVDHNVEPGSGGNYVGGSSYPGGGFPTGPSSWGLALAIRDRDPIGRAINVAAMLLRRYGRYCAIAPARLLEAENAARRYAGWLQGSLADQGLRRRAKLTILRALGMGLQSVVVACAGGQPLPRDLQAQAREAIRIANGLTGDPTNA